MEYEEIQERLKKLRETPPVKVKEDVMAKAYSEFEQRFNKSKEIHNELKKYIPAGVEHMNSIQKPFPLIIDKADGAYLYDVNGEKFIDYLATSGPCMLGHNYREVKDYVIEVINKSGPMSGLTTQYELEAAKSICKHFNSVEKVRFYQSGTEVAMAMARLARLYTGKSEIIKIQGGYHGWSDQFCLELHIPGTGNMFAKGIPEEYYAHTQTVPPNNIKAIEDIIKNFEDKGGVAAIVLEPFGGDSATFPPYPDYNKEVRELCDKHDVLMVFDEVVTGFRVGMGGAQEYFGIDTDLTMFGKIIGHEYPSAGALGGRSDIMDRLVANAAAGVDDENVFTAGTLAGTNVTCAACTKTIECLEKTNALEKSAKTADKLVAGLNDIFATYDLPFFTYNYKSIIQLRLSGFYNVDLTKPNAIMEILSRRENGKDYNVLLALENIITLQAIRAYTTLAHSEDEGRIVGKTLKGFENMCKKI
jgi:glutamate-1-semialdehyde 2,1-aminomutase